MLQRNLPFFSQSERTQVIEIPLNNHTKYPEIRSGRGYFRLRFLDMRLSRNFVATTKLLSALYARFEGFDGHGEAIISPQAPAGNIKSNLGNVHIATQAITPTVPFRDQAVKATFDLVAVPHKDLAEDMLGLLNNVTNVLQMTAIGQAIQLTDLLRNGLNALLNINDAKSVLGWQGEVVGTGRLTPKVMVVVPPDASLNPSQIKFKQSKLLYEGKPLDFTDYFAVMVETSILRGDWKELPEISLPWQEWQKALRTHSVSDDEYNTAASALRVALYNSPNLTERQADEIEDRMIKLIEKDSEKRDKIFRAEGGDMDLDEFIQEHDAFSAAEDEFDLG